MPTFSYREKNVTISVRCGARCRAYHASSMGEGKGPPHNCAPARFLFFGFFNSMESAFPYEESFSVRPNPVRRRPRRTFLRPDVVPHCPQSLISPSTSTTSLGPNGLSSGRAWCLTVRKALCLRPEAPCPRARTDFPPARRGASLPAKPYSSVDEHHVPEPSRASGDPDVVLHRPQSLIPSSGSTTSIGRVEPPATRAWYFTVRKALFLRPEAPRLSAGPSLRRPGRGASPSAKPYSFVRKHHVYRPGRASGDPAVVLHHPQRLISSSGNTTPPSPIEPPAPQLASPFSQNLNSSSGHANLAGPSLRQPGLPFSHKKRMRRTYII